MLILEQKTENFITKSKNIYENRSANQIDLFGENNSPDSEVIIKIDDWKFEERLSKEFESVGFFISCLLYTSPSPRDTLLSRMPSSA